MPLSIGRVSTVLTRSGVVHHLLGDDAVLLACTGRNTRVRLAISVLQAGRYLHVRTLGLAHCPPVGAVLERVATVLNEVNLRYAYTKYGWNAEDGEICLETDLPVEDSTTTSDDQILSLIMGLVHRCDDDYPAIESALSGTARGLGRRPPPRPWVPISPLFAPGPPPASWGMPAPHFAPAPPPPLPAWGSSGHATAPVPAPPPVNRVWAAVLGAGVVIVVVLLFIIVLLAAR